MQEKQRSGSPSAADLRPPAASTTAPRCARSDDPRSAAGTAALPDEQPDGPAAPASSGLRARRRFRITALIVGLVLLLVVGGLGLGGRLYARSVGQEIERVDAFSHVPEAERPTRAASKALNLLILGSDSRDPDTKGSRTDTIMVLHLPAARDRAQLISIPRDTWVTVPKSADGRTGGANAKINTAYAWGGTSLMVRTVESFTAVRIDHVLLIDFAGFQRIVDAVGGVEIDVDRGFTSIHPPHRTFTAGRQRLNGAAALDYSRQRKQFSDGDFARIRHQQQVIAAIMDQAAAKGFLANPVRLNSFLRATADAITADKTLSVFDLAWEMRGVRSSDLSRLTSPSSGTGTEGDESVVYTDTGQARRLYQAVKDDAMEKWLADNPPS
ncbi:LCP family protein [Micromonospora sp. NPDC049679]|uniref:LCP family protein n=1 Tax=Micromonospora sp. NPDC049679 TaxID=3155920 RepID=UPI0033CFE5CC